MILLPSNPSEDVNANGTFTRRYIMRIVTLLTVVSLALVLSLARADDTLVKFDGGIGVDPVSNAQGMAATANVVTRNIVRGVQPAQRWVIHPPVERRPASMSSPHSFVKTSPLSSNAIPTRFPSPRTGTSRSTTCCRRLRRRRPALHLCC
jgi:hypothetical protein